MKNLIGKRFEELTGQIELVEQTLKTSSSDGLFGGHEYFDSNAILGWLVKTKNLLVKVAGENSEHYKSILASEKNHPSQINHNLMNIRLSFLLRKKILKVDIFLRISL